MLEPVDVDFFGGFNEDACTKCGECLSKCPVMDLSKEETIDEMKRLIAGEKTKKVLKKCQSCFSCNIFCPEHANPASLILQRWNEEYKENGLKIRGKYYMTFHPQYPNFRSYVLDRMPEASKEMLKQWAELSPLKTDTLTYPGCNVITYPELTKTSMFKDLEIRGRLEYCCGETLFRTGYKDQLFQVTKRLDHWFNQLKPKNLVVLCTAGTNVFKNVLPHYGLTYKFDSIKSYLQYIWEKIEQGQIKFTRQLDMKVTIQESCYAKMFGDEYMDLPRKILERIGVQVIEAPANRECMRCCGIGGGFSMASAYHPMDIINSASRNLKDFNKTGADAICVYCAGCLVLYGVMHRIKIGKKIKIFHIIELLQQALGEESLGEDLKKKRSRVFFSGIAKKQFPKVLSRKTFKIAEIPETPLDYGDSY
ncbi:MAG: (Fe-S)-binding protein [Candidatus Hodarchaeota archaeon]